MRLLVLLLFNELEGLPNRSSKKTTNNWSNPKDPMVRPLVGNDSSAKRTSRVDRGSIDRNASNMDNPNRETNEKRSKSGREAVIASSRQDSVDLYKIVLIYLQDSITILTKTVVKSISANMAVDALSPVATVLAPTKPFGIKPEVTVFAQNAPTVAPTH